MSQYESAEESSSSKEEKLLLKFTHQFQDLQRESIKPELLVQADSKELDLRDRIESIILNSERQRENESKSKYYKKVEIFKQSIERRNMQKGNPLQRRTEKSQEIKKSEKLSEELVNGRSTVKTHINESSITERR